MHSPIGSVKNVGDKVMYKYLEDEEDYLHGTIVGKVDDETAKVEVIIYGRKRVHKDVLDIRFDELEPCI